jgi:hypothetical protein
MEYPSAEMDDKDSDQPNVDEEEEDIESSVYVTKAPKKKHHKPSLKLDPLSQPSPKRSRKLVVTPDTRSKDPVDTTLNEFTLDLAPLDKLTPPSSPLGQSGQSSFILPTLPESDIDRDWEEFIESIINPKNGDDSVGEPSPVDPLKDETVFWMESPHISEYLNPLQDELIDYERGMDSVLNAQTLPLTSQFLTRATGSLKEGDDTNESDAPAYSEESENDWDIGLQRLEHLDEFQNEAGLDLGDDHQGLFDDDEGDQWSDFES